MPRFMVEAAAAAGAAKAGTTAPRSTGTTTAGQAGGVQTRA